MTTAALNFRWILALLSVFTIGSPVFGQIDCPNEDDYSPCTCYSQGTYRSIRCDQIDLAVVKETFKRPENPADFDSFYLCPPSKDLVIPTELLSNKRIGYIQLVCPSPSYRLKIDPGAFRSSKNYTTQLYFGSCDMDHMDMSFLAGFEQLTSLKFFDCRHTGKIHWSSLPALPNLSKLEITSSHGLNEWTEFPQLGNGLTEIDLGQNGLKDESMNRILSWAVQSSGNTLRKLQINSNSLTSIPRQISSMTNLVWLDLSNQKEISIISRGSLSFSVPVDHIFLNTNGIKTIEAGAFKGDFTRARIYLQSNKLTRLESSVYEPVLQQMASQNGSIVLGNNPFDCTNDPCHLAWIIRDNPQMVNKVIFGGACNDVNNPTGFLQLIQKSLKEGLFDSCNSSQSLRKEEL